ncbi:MAG TPA: nucleoside recognition family protein [Spirochaetota bacterium]|nr:nucleoside recognition family protein [Spirochaetota bacterium]
MWIIDIIKTSGKTGFEIGVYILLPILVVMMAFMRLIEKKGILVKIAFITSPVMFFSGLPAIGLFAVLQILFVNFAAPLATLAIMEEDDSISEREVAAVLAVIFSMPQANATFPLTLKGLNLGITIFFALISMFLTGMITYHLLTRNMGDHSLKLLKKINYQKSNEKILRIIMDSGAEGFKLALNSIPMIIIALFIVNVLKGIGFIEFLESVLKPVFSHLGIPSTTVLPVVTKYIAGGTAMMGVTIDLMDKGLLNSLDLNRIAGFVINPLDPVGVAILASSSKTSRVLKKAIMGGIIGILIKGILHIIYF